MYLILGAVLGASDCLTSRLHQRCLSKIPSNFLSAAGGGRPGVALLLEGPPEEDVVPEGRVEDGRLLRHVRHGAGPAGEGEGEGVVWEYGGKHT